MCCILKVTIYVWQLTKEELICSTGFLRAAEELKRRLQADGQHLRPAGIDGQEEEGEGAESSSDDSDSERDAGGDASSSESDSDGEEGGQPLAAAGGNTTNGAGQARAKRRSEIERELMMQALDIPAWDQALGVYQESLDRGLRLGVETQLALIQAAVETGGFGVEDGFEVAHAVMDRLPESGEY